MTIREKDGTERLVGKQERDALLATGLYEIKPELQKIIEQEGDTFREPYDHYFIWGRRNPVMLGWLGYVSVPPSSPLTDRSIVEAADAKDGINVHGGLTCMGLVKDPEHPDYTVYGFDCLHGWDITPLQCKAIAELGDLPGQKYRTKEYTKNQCMLLAEQLKRIEYNANKKRV